MKNKHVFWVGLLTISCCLVILSKGLIPGSPRASRFLRNVPGPRYWYLLRFESEKGWNSIPNFSIFFCMSTFPPLCLLFFRFTCIVLLSSHDSSSSSFLWMTRGVLSFSVHDIRLIMLKWDRVLGSLTVSGKPLDF